MAILAFPWIKVKNVYTNDEREFIGVVRYIIQDKKTVACMSVILLNKNDTHWVISINSHIPIIDLNGRLVGEKERTWPCSTMEDGMSQIVEILSYNSVRQVDEKLLSLK